MAEPAAATADPTARIRLDHLDALWFQVAGTLCNLECAHCFISCSPTNRTFGLLDLETFRAALAEGLALGVREVYFTGGEPFLHRDLVTMLAESVAVVPTTVLTNGMLLRDDTIQRLARARDASRYSLELRISIDGPDAPTNDAIRGEGSFARAIDGVRRLAAAGFLPILTCTRTWPIEEEEGVLHRFRTAMVEAGCERPRIKVLPALAIGAEAERSGGYAEDERVSQSMLATIDPSTLVCSSARIVTERGVWVCPILLDSPEARMGSTLAQSLGEYPLDHGACTTCWAHGAICSNAATARGSE
jgi:uncharacterized Fe-S cluster-containing radical SAM superfamily protein